MFRKNSPLSGQVTRRRMKQMREATGRGPASYFGHSPKIYSSIIVTQAGAPFQVVQRSRRWKSATIPAHYF